MHEIEHKMSDTGMSITSPRRVTVSYHAMSTSLICTVVVKCFIMQQT